MPPCENWFSRRCEEKKEGCFIKSTQSRFWPASNATFSTDSIHFYLITSNYSCSNNFALQSNFLYKWNQADLRNWMEGTFFFFCSPHSLLALRLYMHTHIPLSLIEFFEYWKRHEKDTSPSWALVSSRRKTRCATHIRVCGVCVRAGEISEFFFQTTLSSLFYATTFERRNSRPLLSHSLVRVQIAINTNRNF